MPDRAVAPLFCLSLLSLAACDQVYRYASIPTVDAASGDGGQLVDAETEAAVLTDGQADTLADAPHGDGTVLLDESADEVAVEIPGRLRIVFMRRLQWQAGAVYDLAVAPGVNLVPANGQSKHAVLVSPIGILPQFTWLTLDEGADSAMAARRLAPDQVEVNTSWRWLHTATYDVVATHRIDAYGVWQVEVTVTPNGPVHLDGFEFAYVNVDSTLGWDVTVAPDQTSFALARQGPASATFFRVSAGLPVDGLSVNNDVPGNYYFICKTGVDPSGSNPLEVRWRIRFGPP